MRTSLSFLAVALAIALPAPAASAATCRVPRGAEVLLRAKQVVVYERTHRRATPAEHSVRACSRVNGRVSALAGWDEDQAITRPVSRFASSGSFLAFAHRNEDRNGVVSVTVQRWNVRRAQRLESLQMISTGTINATSHQADADRVLIDRRGRVAATATENGTGIVHAFDARGDQELARGSGVDTRSLRLAGGEVTWTQDGAPRSFLLR